MKKLKQAGGASADRSKFHANASKHKAVRENLEFIKGELKHGLDISSAVKGTALYFEKSSAA